MEKEESKLKEVDNLIIRRDSIPKSHSIIALNLQTVEDVEQVIRQCEALKGQMQGGLEEEPYLAEDNDFTPFAAAKKY